MVPFKPDKKGESPLKILCLGAHSDDIEIGCGGSVVTLLEKHQETKVDWVVFSSNSDRAEEANTSAKLFLDNAGEKRIVIKDFQDGFFPYIGGEIKFFFEELKSSVNPDIIFTHFRHDLHQDHRLISELTWNTFRDHLILEYEIIKYDGDLGAPNLFIHLSRDVAEKKVGTIVKVFNSQGRRSWFTNDAFLSIMRIRGLESNAPEKYAEAFYCRKMIF
jgi:LmbE family N-acetylglucosaminyl deacetylase